MRRYLIIGAMSFMLFSLLLGFSQVEIQENRPPEIKIIEPLASSTFSWNSIIPYSIQVSDYEDGNSEYDEINPNEVLLIVKYLKDSSEIKPYLSKESQIDYQPLVQMGTTTCFSCHKAKGKLIGPSFELIAGKYQNDSETVEKLAQTVIKGGTSHWGDEQMPPHPNLSLGQAKEMIRWILENNSDSSKDYLTGIEGAIQTPKQSAVYTQKGVFVLRASYTDHGTSGQPENRKQVQKTIMLKSN